MFDMSNVTPLFTQRSQTRALDHWRQAARLVHRRWRDFGDAGAANRRSAFASFVAALDAEEAAAAEMAIVFDDIAA
jgi:hypothetical protein